MRTRITIVSLLVLALSFSAKAEDSRAQWKKALIKTSELLKEGSHKDAIPILKRVTRDMVDRLGPGDASSQFFSLVLTHRALAEAGLRNHEEALWYWHVALSLYPALARSDLSMFGDAGTFLKENTLLRDEALRNAKDLSGTVLPPKVKSYVKPKFPEGARHFGIEGILIVEAVITKEGKVTAPRVLQALPAPTLSYSALEAMKKWSFKPATKDGQPIDVLFNLTVNYKLD